MRPGQPSTPRHSPRRDFLKRLSMYLFGIAIGLVFLSMIQRFKQMSSPPTGPAPAQQDASQAASPTQPAPPDETR